MWKGLVVRRAGLARDPERSRESHRRPEESRKEHSET